MFSIDDLNKKMEFNVPDGYFEKMQNEVFAKIHWHKKKLKQRKIIYSIGSIAASLLIIINVVYFYPEKNSENFASLVPEKKEAQQPLYNNIIEHDLIEVKNNSEIGISRKNKTSDKQIVAEMELDNLDYNIIEYYEESMYDLVLLDLYY